MKRPRWTPREDRILRDQSSEERKKWIRFACLVKGWDANEYLAGQAD